MNKMSASTGTTQQYHQRQEKLFRCFLQVCAESPNPYIKDYCKLVRLQNGESVPVVVYKCLNYNTRQDGKNALGNMLKIFATSLKNHEGTAPAQPNTVGTSLRALMSKLKSLGVPFSIKDFSGTGSLDAFLKQYWDATAKEDPVFGTRPNKGKITTAMIQRIVVVVNSKEFQYDQYIRELFAFGLGLQAGIRGEKELVNLCWGDFEIGEYDKFDVHNSGKS